MERAQGAEGWGVALMAARETGVGAWAAGGEGLGERVREQGAGAWSAEGSGVAERVREREARVWVARGWTVVVERFRGTALGWADL